METENKVNSSKQDLLEWLLRHEEDISLDINDFGDLKLVFFEVVGRNPCYVTSHKQNALLYSIRDEK